MNKKIEQFVNLFEAENRKLNLCKFGDREEFIKRHVMDSWEAGQFLEDSRKVVDLGTGGGLPGLILAIEKPDIEFTLIDSVRKKCDSVDIMAKELELSNVDVVCGRAEELGHEMREVFDAATARALAPLPVLLELAAGFIRPGGLFIAYKGSKYLQELEEAKNAIEILGFELEKIHHYERVLLIFRKTKSLSSKYPRKNGTPKKRPL
ncbi:MAG: 16S rRNA (guanine(527)-N(7))-methyltransferase RsmG [Patescibacteria group bacterium]|nr:16S rRNA (guanine(527)-N(7))-methyltransferase RsmG [Patescibacteria group bacterium]